MASPKPIRPVQKLTVMIDACVYRGNPAVGEQLACIFSAMQKQGVECSVLQDRFCLMEATGHLHELMLSEDIAKQAGWVGGSSSPLPERIKNYLHVTREIAAVAPIHYVQAKELEDLYKEKDTLTRTYLLGNPRLKTEWPKTVRKLRDETLQTDQLDEYMRSVFATCLTCSKTIEAIHQRMKHENGFRESLSTTDKAAFMLDQFPEGRKIFWDHIDLNKVSPDHLPSLVIDAFGRTNIIRALFGTRDSLTPLGKLQLHNQMDMGERVAEKHALEIVSDAKAPKPASDNIVLFITDDKEGLNRFEQLQAEHPYILPITSRELATITCDLAKVDALKPFFPLPVLQIAAQIDDGIIKTDSPIARSAQNIPIGDSSFVQRVRDNASLTAEDRARLIGM